MERFMVLTTTTEQPVADKLADILENAGIPVMIEHVEITGGARQAIGFRVLVPQRHTHNAMRLLSAATASYPEHSAA